jgi:hypothetical protein
MKSKLLSVVLAIGVLYLGWNHGMWLPCAAIGLLLLRWFFVRSRESAWLKHALGETLDGNAAPIHACAHWPWEILWLIAGLVAMLGAFCYLESREPFYFTQDDNFCVALPELLQGCRSFFSGVFPQWNPYQMLGCPSSSTGLYGYTYPPTYAAYFIARFVISNEYYTVEALVFIHLIGGFLATYWAARQWRIGPPLAMVAGLSYMLSGYTLVTGRSWSNMLGAIAWLPVLIGAVGCMMKGPVGWKWAVGCGVGIGLFFHCGFVQMWVFALLFCPSILVVLVASRQLPLRRATWSFPAVLLGIALATPLLYVQMGFGAEVMRADAGLGMAVKDLLAMILPYPLTRSGHPQNYAAGTPSMGIIFYSGTAPCVVAALTISSLLGVKWSKRALAENVLLICALLALLMAFGDKAYLWAMLRKLPWFDKFRNAERFLPFFVLFTGLGSGRVLHRIFSGWKNPKLWEAGAAVIMSVLVAYTVSLPPPSYWSFRDRPYPKLPASLESQLRPSDPLKPQRIATLMPMDENPRRADGEGYVFGMEQSFASAYSLLAFNGYQPLVWNHRIYKEYVGKHLESPGDLWDLEKLKTAIALQQRNRSEVCKVYGVDSLILYGEFAPLFVKYYPALAAYAAEDAPVFVMKVPGVSPLAFPEHIPEAAFPIQFSARGTTVDVSALTSGGSFIINILAWPDFRVYADGHEIPFVPDEWGRMRVQVPAQTAVLEARYSPPWGKGIGLGMALGIVSIVAIITLTNGLREHSSRTDG